MKQIWTNESLVSQFSKKETFLRRKPLLVGKTITPHARISIIKNWHLTSIGGWFDPRNIFSHLWMIISHWIPASVIRFVCQKLNIFPCQNSTSFGFNRSYNENRNKFINFLFILFENCRCLVTEGKRSVSNSWPQINLIRMCKWYCLFIYLVVDDAMGRRQWIIFYVAERPRDENIFLCTLFVAGSDVFISIFFVIDSLFFSAEKYSINILKIDMCGL